MKSTSLKRVFAVLGIFAITTGASAFSQTKDTTEIRVGEKKIIIIEDNSVKSDAKKLEGIDQKITNLEAKNNQLKQELTTTTDENRKEQIEEEIELNEDKISEYKDVLSEKKEIETEYVIEIEGLEEELSELGHELEIEINDEINIENNCENSDKKCKKNKDFDGHWSGFELGLNNYVVSDLDFNIPAGDEFMELKPNLSWGFALNLPEVSIPLFSRYMGFVTGLGLEWNNYRLKQNIDLVEESTGIVAQYIDVNERKYEKNSLNALYLNIPFIYEFQIPVNHKDKRIFLGVGVEAGVKLSSKTKKTYVLNGEERTINNKDDYNLNPFKYGLTARFGIDDAQVFVNYSLSPLFEVNQGPELYPVSAGIRLNF